MEHQAVCTNRDCDHYYAPTSLEREFGKARKAIAISLFSFCLLFTFEDMSQAGYNSDNPVLSTLTPEAEEATLELVREELERQNVLCADQVLAQVKLESANLTSYLYGKTNNMFGMRYPAKRKTAACGIYLPAKGKIIYGTQDELRKYSGMNNYAVYDSWKDAIADYKLWQTANFNVKEKYTEFLGRVYAEDSLYASKIRKMSGIAR